MTWSAQTDLATNSLKIGWMAMLKVSIMNESSSLDKYQVEYFTLIDRMIHTLYERFDDQYLMICDDFESALINTCSNNFIIVEISMEYSEDSDREAFSRELRMQETLGRQVNNILSCFC